MPPTTTESQLKAVQFVAAYCGYKGSEPSTSESGQLQLAHPAGLVTGFSSVCHFIASQSSQSTDLLGSSPEIQAQVTEWLSWCGTELAPLVDDKLVKVNDWLLTRTFMVGSSLTLADLAVFGTLYPAAAGFPAAQVLHFCNILRWCDFIQHVADKTGLYTPLKLLLPKFQPPAPVPAPAPKANSTPTASSSTPAPAASSSSQAQPAKKEPTKSAPAPADPTPETGTKGPAAEAPKAEEAKGKEKGKDKGKEKDKPSAAPAAKDDEARIDMLDIRVGVITKVDKHPNADSLYLEEIDVGEEKPRQVISGLVKFVPVEQMQNRRVVVVCNLKPAKMREVMSYGMVLCASNPDHTIVEPLVIPDGVPVGERIKVEGYDNAPLEEVNPKKKLLERLFPDMKTDDGGVAVYKGAKFTTSQGPLTSSITLGNVA